RHDAGEVWFELGSTSHQAGRRDKAEKAYRRARELHTGLVAQHPVVPSHRSFLAKDEVNLGRFLAEAGQTTEAKELLRRGEENLETLLRAHPEDLEYRGDLAECLSVRGMLHRESGAAGALPTYRRAREILEALPHPSADALFILAG